MIKILLVFILYTSLYGDGAVIPKIVLDAIEDTECLRVDGIKEPYFIRLNKMSDVEKAYNEGFIGNKKRIVRCKNASMCSKKVSELLSLGIVNMDLGPHQINYFYQSYRWKDDGDYTKYFQFSESEKRAREILGDLIQKYGYSWRTIARYHHYDPKNKKRNRAYYGKLYKYVYGVSIPKVLVSSK